MHSQSHNGYSANGKKQVAAGRALPPMHQAFLIAYLNNGWNGVEAAKQAGMGRTYASSAVCAFNTLRNVKVKQAINEALRDQGLDELHIKARLAEVAKASVAWFLDKRGRVKLSAVRRYGHLVRSYECASNGKPAKITLHDPLRAIEMAARIAGMFQDKMELSGGTTETRTARIEVVVLSPKQVGNGDVTDAEVVTDPVPQGNGK